MRILTSKDPLKSVESQTQDLQLDSNVIHPVVYISGSFSQSQCKLPAVTKNVLVSLCPSKSVPFFTKHPLGTLGLQGITQNFHRT